ncbi:MAG: NAD(+) synthase [Firmicutes bacterium]|nr:NAD(+) synthase [Bacillota bacterium]
MRDYEFETKRRVRFIEDLLNSSGAEGIVYGNSGGKDSALVGILCKVACENTVGIIMPCGSKRNYEADRTDAEMVARQYAIATRVVDLAGVRNGLIDAITPTTSLTESALTNIAPRLRMTALYAIAASENRLVAGTGNRSESYLGYFTKWGDGACDFNVINDLTVGEVLDFLRYLQAPPSIIDKAPSAGLFDGQTDEAELGLKYSSVDSFLLTGKTDDVDRLLIEKLHRSTMHKRRMPMTFWESHNADQ